MTTTPKYRKCSTPLQETNRRNQVASWAYRRGLAGWKDRALARGKEIHGLKVRISSLEDSRENWKTKSKSAVQQLKETEHKLNEAEQRIVALQAELAQKKASSPVSASSSVLVASKKKIVTLS